MLILASSLLLAASGGLGPVQSEIYVDDDAPPGGDGSGWGTAFATLQDGLAVAVPGDEIRVAQGTYTPDVGGSKIKGDRSASFGLVAGTALLGGYRGLQGGGDPDDRDATAFPVFLSGDLLGDDGPDFVNNDENSQHVVRAQSLAQPVRLDGVYVVAGNIAGTTGSAGLQALATKIEVTSVVFRGNDGRGAEVRDGRGTFQSCLFEGNRAIEAGGGLHTRSKNTDVLDCTFVGNFSDDDGGGYYGVVVLKEAVLRVIGCRFEGNEAGWRGGGMMGLSNFGQVVVEDSVFFDNLALEAGGLQLWGTGGIEDSARVVGCHFEANRAPKSGAGNSPGSGGGMLVKDTDAKISWCTFLNNYAVNDGGGLLYEGFSDSVPPMIVNCAFIGNTAANGDGGGCCITEPDSITVNCLFASNTAGVMAGGLRAQNRPFVIGSTFAGNRAGTEGGGAWLGGIALHVHNTVMWGNSAGAGTKFEQQIHLDSGTPDFSYSCIEGWDGSLGGAGNIGSDPMFENPRGQDGQSGTADDDYRLGVGSPCSDAGDEDLVAKDRTDLDGDGDIDEPTPLDLAHRERFSDDPNAPNVGNGFPPVDMGAYERAGCGAETTCVALPNSTGVGAGFQVLSSFSISANDTVLSAIDCPIQEFGFFIYGEKGASLPFGNGLLCVSPFNPGIRRLLPPVIIDNFGFAAHKIDFPALPPGGTITVGSTWHFQFVFRDSAAGGANFNTSDGVAATFCD